MKTKLFTYGTLVAMACAASFTLFSAFAPQDVSPQYVTMYTYVNEAKIAVVYENNTVEEIQLEKGSKPGSAEKNYVKIHETLNMLSHKGYRLVSTVNLPKAVGYICERKKP